MSSQSKNEPTYTPFGGIISQDVKSHINDPQAIEKANRSLAIIDKYGFPELPKKNNSK